MLPGVEKYLIPGTNRVDYEDPDAIRAFLRDYDGGLLRGLEDHKQYIEMVAGYRRQVEKWTAQNGKNFLKTIRNVFAVGEDGLYSNSFRFLFELIQNVDDCDYAPDVEPKLAICFDMDQRRLVFRYNEVGFKPCNVFAITGIAEESKNTDEKKLQIGEKGIGFKSVFGVANSVLIRSGKFSFRLDRDRFTVPMPEYSDDFQGVDGTELTLEFDSDDRLNNVMNSVMERYRKDNALFTQNPIVFLNKLHGLEFVSGDEQLLSFSIDRPVAEKVEGKNISITRGMTLALHRKGRPDKPITGTMCSTTMRYSREDCQSRYGNDTLLGSREMKVEVFFPDVQHVISETGKGPIEHGLMYSFLPTQVELEVPVICHAPFKLDASREYGAWKGQT